MKYRDSTDYTDKLKDMYDDWNYDHLVRCNRYCKIYVDETRDIKQAVENYRSAFMNKEEN